MTTQQIADRLVTLLRQAKFDEVYTELFHPSEVRHLEPQSPHFPDLTGVPAIREKDALMSANIAAMDELEVGDAVVAKDFFAVPYKVALTMQDGSTFALDEIIVYQVRDGKIVLEQFFY